MIRVQCISTVVRKPSDAAEFRIAHRKCARKGGEAERHIPLLGDEYLLVEFGEISTDFFYNLRAKAFAERTEEARKGIAFP